MLFQRVATKPGAARGGDALAAAFASLDAEMLEAAGRQELTSTSLSELVFRKVQAENKPPAAHPYTLALGGEDRGEGDQTNPWHKVIRDLTEAWTDEAGESAAPAAQIREFCFDTLDERRRNRKLGGGVLLTTLHGVKGMEFPDVLIADGGWRSDAQKRGCGEEGRRLFYVGITRAQETLTLVQQVIVAGMLRRRRE